MPRKFLLGEENDPDAIKHIEKSVKYMKVSANKCIALILVLTVVVFVLNYMSLFKPIDESSASWFQRSGAIIVAVAVLIETILTKMENVISNASVTVVPNLFRKVYKYQTHVTWFHRLVLLLVISGTIIWSYGEPIYNAF